MAFSVPNLLTKYNQLMPSACETDITGVVSMYALQLAFSFPGALVDGNNNYADDPDRCVLFNCGNWARSFVPEIEIKSAPIHGLHQVVVLAFSTGLGLAPRSYLDAW